MIIILELKSNTYSYQKKQQMLTMYKITDGRTSASVYITNRLKNPFDTMYENLNKTSYDYSKKSKS